MNKKLLSLFALLTGIFVVGYLHASPNDLAITYNTLELTASSGVIKSQPGWIKGVILSTPTENSVYGRDWLVFINTPTPKANTAFTSFTSANKLTLPLVYTSTPTTIGTVPQPNTNVFYFPEPGIYFSSSCYYFKTQTNSGEAFKASVMYK